MMVRAIRKKPKLNKCSKKGESSAMADPAPRVWQPGVDKMEEDEELQYDPSAYDSLHSFHLSWPCLSFDIIHDSVGLIRTVFPHTAYLVAGTQANQPSLNSIEILKASNISGKIRDVTDSDDSIDTDDGDDSDSDSDTDDEMPVLELRRIAHHGCVNRVRCMPHYPHSICATWSDTGVVQVWDLSAHISFLERSDATTQSAPPLVYNQAPLAAFKHKDEGYAIDWSPRTCGRLISGDCNNSIYLWEPISGGKWNVDHQPFVGHTASVEDLKWSPVEDSVFASCSVDGNICLWDTRKGKSPALSIKGNDVDVNVIAWNSVWSNLLASGSDDGTISVHDLRMVQMGTSSQVAKFEYHKHPITSIEWGCSHGNLSNSLAVSSSDNQLTIWDPSSERDDEADVKFGGQTKENAIPPKDLTDQLDFVHQGQKDVKELHWHPQIPGMIISTASDGFNIFIPSNVRASY